MATPATGFWFPNILAPNNISWASPNLKAAAVLGTWSPNIDAPLGWADDSQNTSGHSPSAHEATGTGYSAGGIALTNVVKSVAGGKFYLSADDVVFTSVTLTDVKHIVFYDNSTATGGIPVNKPIIAVYTYSPTLSNSGGNFTIPLADIADGAPVNNCVGALRNPGS